MKRAMYFLLPFLLTIQFASAEVKNLKLLNPDGSPAIDAKAVGIKTLSARVDENLKELPSLVAVLPERQTGPLRTEEGTIAFDTTSGFQAIVAQNDLGFAFIPLTSNVTTVKLRPWATVKIDVSAVPAERLKGKRFSVVWTNCFAGNALRPEFNDPFGGSQPEVDWRFDRFVTWSRTYDDPQSTIKVPPGEVTVVMSGEGFETADSQNPIPCVTFSPFRAKSKSLSIFQLPKFGEAVGKISQQSDLPDWNQEKGSTRFVRATRFQEFPVPVPAELESAFTKMDLNALASFYATEKGTQFRSAALPEVVSMLNSDDSFSFDNIPDGDYYLEIASPSRNPHSLKYKSDSENKPLKFTVTAGESTAINEADLMLYTNLPERQLPILNTKASGFKIAKANEDSSLVLPNQDVPTESAQTLADTDPIANSNQTPASRELENVIDSVVKKAEAKIAKGLIQVVENVDYVGTPLRQVLMELEDSLNIPIRINMKVMDEELHFDCEFPVTIYLPSMTARSALRHILSSVSEDLTFTIRDEVLLITSKKDAARTENDSLNPNAFAKGKTESAVTPQLDTGKTFIEQWLKSSEKDSNPQVLRQALQNHLEQEFDANQKSRKADLERLRGLLKQSEDWVNTRQASRAEIVRKRLDELLEHSKLTPGIQK